MCQPSISTLSCGSGDGWGGTLRGLRTATKDYFEARIGRGPTIFRKRFEELVPELAGNPADVAEAQVPVTSSRPIQAQTRFVRLKVTYIKGIDLGDVGPDDADMYARATIAGKDYTSAVINHHDLFSFPLPYYPFTFIRSVSRGATYSPPVTNITVRVKTGDVTLWGNRRRRVPEARPVAALPARQGPLRRLRARRPGHLQRPDRRGRRPGSRLEDITQVQIEKSADGAASGGGWAA